MIAFSDARAVMSVLAVLGCDCEAQKELERIMQAVELRKDDKDARAVYEMLMAADR
jgi:hypothetical protein